MNRYFVSNSFESGDNSLYYPNELAYMPFGEFSATSGQEIDYMNTRHNDWHSPYVNGCPPFENTRSKGAFSNMFNNITSKFSIWDVETENNITLIKHQQAYPRPSEAIDRLSKASFLNFWTAPVTSFDVTCQKDTNITDSIEIMDEAIDQLKKVIDHEAYYWY